MINLKIVGEMREGSKVTATSTITGGTEGCSRVQWFKSTSSKFEDENALEALTTSKVAKVRTGKNNGIFPICYCPCTSCKFYSKANSVDHR